MSYTIENSVTPAGQKPAGGVGAFKERMRQLNETAALAAQIKAVGLASDEQIRASGMPVKGEPSYYNRLEAIAADKERHRKKLGDWNRETMTKALKLHDEQYPTWYFQERDPTRRADLERVGLTPYGGPCITVKNAERLALVLRPGILGYQPYAYNADKRSHYAEQHDRDTFSRLIRMRALRASAEMIAPLLRGQKTMLFSPCIDDGNSSPFGNWYEEPTSYLYLQEVFTIRPWDNSLFGNSNKYGIDSYKMVVEAQRDEQRLRIVQGRPAVVFHKQQMESQLKYTITDCGTLNWFPARMMPASLSRQFFKVKQLGCKRLSELTPEQCLLSGTELLTGSLGSQNRFAATDAAGLNNFAYYWDRDAGRYAGMNHEAGDDPMLYTAEIERVPILEIMQEAGKL